MANFHHWRFWASLFAFPLNGQGNITFGDGLRGC